MIHHFNEREKEGGKGKGENNKINLKTLYFAKKFVKLACC